VLAGAEAMLLHLTNFYMVFFLWEVLPLARSRVTVSSNCFCITPKR